MQGKVVSAVRPVNSPAAAERLADLVASRIRTWGNFARSNRSYPYLRLDLPCRNPEAYLSYVVRDWFSGSTGLRGYLPRLRRPSYCADDARGFVCWTEAANRNSLSRRKGQLCSLLA